MVTTRKGNHSKRTSDGSDIEKPRMRGLFHSYASVAALSAGIMLCLDAQTNKALLGTTIYTLSCFSLFLISSIYHTVRWTTPSQRLFMRRADHAAIFLLIAGTYTPLTLLSLDTHNASSLLTIVWTGAFAGIIQCLIFPHTPKPLAASLYVILGWAVLPYAGQLQSALGGTSAMFLIAGGVVYSIGALVYATRRPDPLPHVFGYHEVFHTLIIIAALFHFVVVYRCVHGEIVV